MTFIRDALKKLDIPWHQAKFIWHLPTIPKYDKLYYDILVIFEEPTHLNDIMTWEKNMQWDSGSTIVMQILTLQCRLKRMAPIIALQIRPILFSLHCKYINCSANSFYDHCALLLLHNIFHGFFIFIDC